MIEPAIPTMYNGIRFRSRLEATWARFFDVVEWPWQYEPIDLNGYIPDFILPFTWHSGAANSTHPVLVEVKPVLSLEELRGFTSKIEKSGWDKEALIVGAGPLESSNWSATVLGLLGEVNGEPPLKPGSWWWEEGLFMKCRECGRLSFYHSQGGYDSRICGHYDGDGFLGDGNEEFRVAWAKAKNQTQWAIPKR